MSELCRYCGLPVPAGECVTTHGYWGGMPFAAHRCCRDAGILREAYECQSIDADCNDCRHYKRGKLAPVVISVIKTTDGRFEEVRHQPNVFVGGLCLKFNRLTLAQPNKWTGWPCFEHRRKSQYE